MKPFKWVVALAGHGEVRLLCVPAFYQVRTQEGWPFSQRCILSLSTRGSACSLASTAGSTLRLPSFFTLAD